MLHSCTATVRTLIAARLLRRDPSRFNRPARRAPLAEARGHGRPPRAAALGVPAGRRRRARAREAVRAVLRLPVPARPNDFTAAAEHTPDRQRKRRVAQQLCPVL